MSLEFGTQADTTQTLCGLYVQVKKELPWEETRPVHKIIVVSGPTASGKSELAVRLAAASGGEVVSADSMQVYRGMDIGTAKPTSEQQHQVPHHLIDIRDVSDPINVVDFYYEGACACQNILSRNRVVIIAGGSGFYVHTLLYGPPPGPPAIHEVRSQIEVEMDRNGVEVLFHRLQKLDPEYAQTITRHDRHKIVRALEIIEVTKEKVSALSWKARRQPISYDFRCWFLNRPRQVLYQRIDARCDEMLARGFLDEVSLLDSKGLRENRAAAQAIGYRQALAFLDSAKSAADYDHFVHAFKQATRQYARRQMTWFRKEPLFRWVDVESQSQDALVDQILEDFYH